MVRPIMRLIAILPGILLLWGCSTAGEYRKNIDKTAYQIIEKKQQEALGKMEPFSVEPPEDTLRRRLMILQNLPHSSPASLNTKDLKPIDHWPKDDYLSGGDSVGDASAPPWTGELLKLTLMDTLQISAKNNRQYQTNKESVFRAALSLELQRDSYRNTFTGSMDSNLSTDLSESSATSGVANSGLLGVSRKFMNGISVTGRIGLDLVKLLNPFDQASYSLFGDASVSIPLLRGAGKHIVAEPLTQAERDTIYAIYDFERYKRTFAVNMTSYYLSALQAIDQIENASANYGRAIVSTRLVRSQAKAGKQSQVYVDQTVQQEYSARESWISAQFNYQSRMDTLKIQMGIPPDAQIELDRGELNRLTQSARSLIANATSDENTSDEEIPPAYAPVILPPLTREHAGPMELDERKAIEVALNNRLDLRAAQGEVYDAQRKLVVAADDLRPELTLLGNASAGESRSLGSAGRDNNLDLNLAKGNYNALLTLDLPLERTREIISYRQSILSLESAVRSLQDLEDSIKSNIRTQLRNLQEDRENLLTQAKAVDLNVGRVRNTDLSFQAGRAIVRDVLDAQRDLLSSQNSLTSALVSYRLAELGLQRDLDVLEIDPNGLWKEISPDEL